MSRASWGPLGRLLGPSWDPLGAFLGPKTALLGPKTALLGLPGTPLGALLGPLGALLDPRRLQDPSGTPPGPLRGPSRALPGPIFGRFLCNFGMIFVCLFGRFSSQDGYYCCVWYLVVCLVSTQARWRDWPKACG